MIKIMMKITRSSKHILKYQTKSKSKFLDQLFHDFYQDLQFMMNYILENKLFKLRFGSNIPQNIIKHSRWSQIIYKQASEIIRSQIKFAEQKRYKHYQKIYKKAIKHNHITFINKKFSELKLNPIEKTKYFSIPQLKNLSITLDSRVVDFQMKSKNFDEFIQITTPYFHENKKRAIKLRLPIKHHKHSLKYKDWDRKESIRLRKERGNYFIDLIYEIEKLEIRKDGISLGLDQGANKLLSDSNGNHYGQGLVALYKRINRKCKKLWKQNKTWKEKTNSSINKKKLLIHRNNEMNKVINEFFRDNDKLVHLIIEDLSNIKKSSKNLCGKVKSWVYPYVRNKLEMYCQENGIQLTVIDPSYTSQTCSYCRAIDKRSRHKEVYHCISCDIKIDADTNAAINILRRGVYNHPDPKQINQNKFLYNL